MTNTRSNRCAQIATTLCAVTAGLMLPGVAAAYVGPGAGLGLIGSLLAVIAALLVGVVGLVVFPVRLLMKKRRAESNSENKPDDTEKTDADPAPMRKEEDK